MRQDPERPPIPLALVAVPESAAYALYGIREVFASVGVAWAELTGANDRRPWFEVTVVAAGRAPFTAAGGVPVVPDAAFAEAPAAALVIVPDLVLDPGAAPHGRWPEACAWLRARHAAGATVCAVCSGTLLLAESGLLDGLPATTHWGFGDTLRRHYPAVDVRIERTLVPAGPEARLITTGGAAAWEDLALYLIARFCGPDEAVRTAKVYLFGDRGAGQLPFTLLHRPRDHADPAVAAAQVWVGGNYACRRPVAGMAERAGLPPRSFARRFRKATGLAPIDYVQALRIEEAKQLLERSALAVDLVAAEVGYEDPVHFRRVFRRLVGETPGRYRRRFAPVTGAAPGGGEREASAAARGNVAAGGLARGRPAR